jgi:hypothetical protein
MGNRVFLSFEIKINRHTLWLLPRSDKRSVFTCQKLFVLLLAQHDKNYTV